ncbi:MAG TPA: endolytic transglycosylase MltG [Acidobacteriaceae bacterium]|nr:endolytic transglycosylase MltG [Acidobacteriaceae bacterium]
MRLLKAIFLLILLAAAAVGFYFYLPYGPTQETFVDILSGTGTQNMAAQLQHTGIIRSRYAFDAMRLAHGGPLKAGEYRFDHKASLIEIYQRIRKGDVYTRMLVIPEGFNIFDIAQAVETAGLGSKASFLEAEKQNTALIAQWSPGASSLEGYLFPDTYRFSRHATPPLMLATMVKRFGQKTAELNMGPGTDVSRAVIIASLVEKEVHIDAERPLVAGVFENRFAAGMPLQTDPSVAYASLLNGTWTGVIHQSELHADSGYNTYVHPGLPPGPICNPGVSALKAALQPAKTDFLYFVADSSGATRFSKDITEHDAQVAAFRANSR